MVDETTDAQGRPICAILAGSLEEDDSLKKPFLIDLVDLENTNSASVSQAINTSLFNVFDGMVPLQQARPDCNRRRFLHEEMLP